MKTCALLCTALIALTAFSGPLCADVAGTFDADADLWLVVHVQSGYGLPVSGDWHIMFYIGFGDEDHARIGLARSRDGVTDWQRHPANPIIFPAGDAWDADACYKPFAIFDEAGDRWLLWYNGRKGPAEQIGLATHPGRDLAFPQE